MIIIICILMVQYPMHGHWTSDIRINRKHEHRIVKYEFGEITVYGALFLRKALYKYLLLCIIIIVCNVSSHFIVSEGLNFLRQVLLNFSYNCQTTISLLSCKLCTYIFLNFWSDCFRTSRQSLFLWYSMLVDILWQGFLFTSLRI